MGERGARDQTGRVMRGGVRQPAWVRKGQTEHPAGKRLLGDSREGRAGQPGHCLLGASGCCAPTRFPGQAVHPFRILGSAPSAVMRAFGQVSADFLSPD